MPWRLDVGDPRFETAFAEFLGVRRGTDDDVAATVSAIIAEVRENGDAALIAACERFDRVRLTAETLAVPAHDLAAAHSALAPEVQSALEMAAASFPTTSTSMTTRAWRSVTGGRRSPRSGSTSPAAPPPIRRRC